MAEAPESATLSMPEWWSSPMARTSRPRSWNASSPPIRGWASSVTRTPDMSERLTSLANAEFASRCPKTGTPTPNRSVPRRGIRVGYRIQGVLLRAKPDAAGLAALEKAYGYKLFELTGRGLWLLDLGVPEPAPGDLKKVKAARPLASSYVDALRVIGCDEEPLEQLAWLTAGAAAARHLRQPVLVFLSDDEEHDFVAVITRDGVSVIGDKLRGYLLRWE